MTELATGSASVLDSKRVFYNRFLLIVAGLGGLLYGVDVGIIAGALPYLQATSRFTAQELSTVVAAVLLGSVLSTLFAGLLADWMGRKWLMVVSGFMFVVSIPMIALAHGYGPLVFGRLLQGVSAGLIGVVVPLYLAECLTASKRGQGTGIFQWLLTAGIAIAALIAFLFSLQLEHVVQTGNAAAVFAFKDAAWRGIFWVSLPPGILFVIGSFLLGESPRWLLRRRTPRPFLPCDRGTCAHRFPLPRPAQGRNPRAPNIFLRCLARREKHAGICPLRPLLRASSPDR